MDIVGAMHPDAASSLGTLGTQVTSPGSGEGQGALQKALDAISALARDMIAGATSGNVVFVLLYLCSCGARQNHLTHSW